MDDGGAEEVTRKTHWKLARFNLNIKVKYTQILKTYIWDGQHQGDKIQPRLVLRAAGEKAKADSGKIRGHKDVGYSTHITPWNEAATSSPWDRKGKKAEQPFWFNLPVPRVIQDEVRFTLRFSQKPEYNSRCGPVS